MQGLPHASARGTNIDFTIEAHPVPQILRDLTATNTDENPAPLKTDHRQKA
ncbi:hypothetical protein PM8797T_01889 [Gimesia maris DSM 8797]|nr:hypothetical protein PM8797T_01889 [Gimesia maris DSM 8797]